MKLLLELLDIAKETKDVHKIRPFLDRITQLLFKQNSDWVRDKKRGDEASFLGVFHTESTIEDSKGRKLKLTFDNSTDSGEFEINSLTPLMIEKGSPLDLAIIDLFDEHHIASKKKTNYISKDGKTVMREIHFGQRLHMNSVKFMKAILHLLHSDKISPVVENLVKSQDFRDQPSWEDAAKKKNCSIKISGGSASTKDRIWFAYDVHKKQVGHFSEEDKEGKLD